MYEKVDNSLNFLERENAVLKFWEQEKIFAKATELREGSELFTFYDGPPTANGKPHIGHVLTRAIKDLIPRYQIMKGKDVLRKAGWDTHGLPVELEVEKLLGIDGKEQIEAYGIEPFIKQCKSSVWKYKAEWEEISTRVGYWADMDDPYVTYDNNYIESEWWALKTIWEKGLLYEGYKVVPYCPRCGTSLSSHEVAQGYQDVKDNSIYVRFAVSGETDTYFAAWTTTPWTLPSNIALCVNPTSDYILAEVDEETATGVKTVRYYIAAELAAPLIGENFRVINKLKGQELEGRHYEPLFPYAEELVKASGRDAFYVTLADFVTLSDGTGIVHMAPAFGEDDAKVGQKYNLPFVQFVRADGTMPPEVVDFAGQFCKAADAGIIKKLGSEGKLMRIMPYEHSYPFCWRCDTPLIYYARNSWFIRMTQLRDNLMRNNESVNWIPANIGTGRFGKFLENVVDWGLSRERYWGTPLPVWRCRSCGKDHVIGSIAELKSMSDNCPDDIELHKPYIDAVKVKCPHCNGEMRRVPEVIDCWFDSGSMPFAQWHYPFENKEKFDKRFPAQFISEAIDQTRGWFYSLIAISTVLFDRSSYENCIVLGHVQDESGRKMSKHLGNVVSPWDILNTEGADALRWYFYTNSQPWLPSRFSAGAVNEAKRKFMGTFWNTYSFFVLYANIDNFNAANYELKPERLGVMDRWILSRLNSLVRTVDTCLSEYNITDGGRALERFVDELSNWYVRRCRERFWVAGMGEDKTNALRTLWEVLMTVAKLSAPFTPFMSETVYRNLATDHQETLPISVHLADFPTVDERFVDSELEAQMDLLLSLLNLGRTARAASGIKTRQPLARMLVVSDIELDAAYASLLVDELNVKAIEWVKDQSSLQDYRFKPQLKLLGKRFGSRLNELKEALSGLNGREAYRSLQKDGQITVDVAGVSENLSEEELLIEVIQSEGFASASDRGFTVALETTLNEALIEEGFVRELTSKVQTMRKEADFEVTDRIVLAHAGSTRIADIIQRNYDLIAADVLAVHIVALEPDFKADLVKDWDINGEAVSLAVRRN